MARRVSLSVAGAAALLLAACGDGDEPPVANVVATPVANVVATPVATPTPVASSVRPAVPDTITVATNEPFFAAAIAGDVLWLSGVDSADRRMAIVAREAVPGGRRWHARDAAGTVVATVTARACADDMLGEARPYSGELRIGERVATGCAFPTPAAAIPARFVGRWDRDAAACARPAMSIEGVAITPNALRFHESVGQVRSVAPDGDAVRIVADYDGEGERWTTRQRLTVADDRLTIVGEGTPIRRVRCPPA